jgi:hypothetical protein
MRVTEDALVSDLEYWCGGSFEAAIVLGACEDPGADDRLRAAVSAIWSFTSLGKCVSDRSRDYSKQKGVDLETASLETISRHLYGVFQSDLAGPFPFSTCVIRETDEEEGFDWLHAGIPIGGIAQVFPSVGGWPAGDYENSRTWREPIERGLAEISLAVSREVYFLITIIDWCVADATPDEIQGKIPSTRCAGYVLPMDGVYKYLPTTDWAAPTMTG